MTIVAYDGKKMIADSLAVASEMKLPGICQKIFEPGPDEYWEINGTRVLVFGMSGLLAAVPYVKELLQKGINHRTIIRPEYDLGFEVLCVLETGDAYVLSTEPSRTKGPGAHDFIMLPVALPIAVGSGAPFALAVMGPKDKNQAEKGVEAAKRLCIHCGGENVVWELPTPPEVKSTRPVLSVDEIMKKDDDQPISNFSLGSLKGLIEQVAKEFIKKADEKAPGSEGNKV